MPNVEFTAIDPVATGANIRKIRKERGLTVGNIQDFLGFSSVNSIFKWQRGETMPSIENLYNLSVLFGCSIEDILITAA